VSRTWLAARPRRRRRPNRPAGRTRERRDPRRSPGRRKGFEAERRRERRSSDPGTSRRGALGGDGDDARPGRSGPDEAKTPAEGVASGRWRNRVRLVGAAPARRLPWQAVATSEGDERGYQHQSFDSDRSRLSRRRAERERAGHALLDAYGEAPPGLPAHSSSTARPADRIVASRAREDGESRVPRSMFAPPMVETRSPPESRTRPLARNPGVASREADRDCPDDRTDA
jgi:hypothetical protein